MKDLGSINATGTAQVEGRRGTFRAIDTPRAVGIAALANGYSVGDLLTVTANYPWFAPSRYQYRLILDDGQGFAERVR